MWMELGEPQVDEVFENMKEAKRQFSAGDLKDKNASLEMRKWQRLFPPQKTETSLKR